MAHFAGALRRRNHGMPLRRPPGEADRLHEIRPVRGHRDGQQLGRLVHRHPEGAMMIVQPTLDMAERWSKQRLAAMIEDCPSLRAKIAPARSRDSGNTTLLKEWAGGVMVISGANSG
ncbi:hypothetical protein EG878_17185, partial [Enterococcus faecalis]